MLSDAKFFLRSLCGLLCVCTVGAALPARQQQLTVAITTCRRAHYLVDALPKYLRMPQVREVVVSDDCASDASQLTVWAKANLSQALRGRLVIFSNEQLLGAFRNMVISVERAKSEWVALMDSDNFADSDTYFAPLLQHWSQQAGGVPDPYTMYMPQRALPRYDFLTGSMGNLSVCDADSWAFCRTQKLGNAFLNTGNAVVHRATSLSAWMHVYEREPEAGLDGEPSIVMACLLVSHGGRLEITPGMTYAHRLSRDSLWLSKGAMENRAHRKTINSTVAKGSHCVVDHNPVPRRKRGANTSDR